MLCHAQAKLFWLNCAAFLNSGWLDEPLEAAYVASSTKLQLQAKCSKHVSYW
jgi:hypothetical protein